VPTINFAAAPPGLSCPGDGTMEMQRRTIKTSKCSEAVATDFIDPLTTTCNIIGYSVLSRSIRPYGTVLARLRTGNNR
jgi:hypothetical protein